MNKWVQSICQIYGFNHAEVSTGFSLRNLSSVSHSPRSSPAEFSSSSQYLLRARKSSAPSHSSRHVSPHHQHRLQKQQGELCPYAKPVSTSPVPSGTNSPALKKSTGNVDYLALGFQPSSPSPHCNPSTSSAMSDEEVHYVQVDKEKTQALQNTIQE
ncbi:GRB2-associated-binding protein 2 [Cricetulus griseus]|uniref:GRB2-associated-binding protein 2 n=1 Tax=Cricetulus griseus TaxID=10029 RepID=G3HRQ8_CRIGR|nr:GRB2-associated-binding protein 2 [Cricetulus griseus]